MTISKIDNAALAKIVGQPSESFTAFVDTIDPSCWARYDLSAVRVGWHFGRQAQAQEMAAMPAARFSLPPDELAYIVAVLRDYAHIQEAGLVEPANRYPVADVQQQADALHDLLREGGADAAHQQSPAPASVDQMPLGSDYIEVELVTPEDALRQVCQRYIKMIDDGAIGEVRPMQSQGREKALPHLRWMLDQIPNLPSLKAQRWLGFVQCALVEHDLTTVEDERKATRGLLMDDLEVQPADIFWDDDNPDLGGYGSERGVAEALAEGMVPAEEWTEFSILRARTLPTRRMRIRLVEDAGGVRRLEWEWADGESE